MTVQQLCDELTILCHNGHARAEVKHVSGELIKSITGVSLIGDDTVLLTSNNIKEILEKERRQKMKYYVIAVYNLFGKFLGYIDDLGMFLDKKLNHAMYFESIDEAEKVRFKGLYRLFRKVKVEEVVCD